MICSVITSGNNSDCQQPKRQEIRMMECKDTVKYGRFVPGVEAGQNNLSKKVRLAQKHILMLRHAAKCCHTGSIPCPVISNCLEMKKLWTHVLSCNDTACQVKKCHSTKSLLSHYYSCENGDRCLVCGPVKKSIRRNANAHRLIVNQNHIKNGTPKDHKRNFNVCIDLVSEGCTERCDQSIERRRLVTFAPDREVIHFEPSRSDPSPILDADNGKSVVSQNSESILLTSSSASTTIFGRKRILKRKVSSEENDIPRI